MTENALPPEKMLALMQETRKRLDRPHTNIKSVKNMLVHEGLTPEKATELVSNVLQGIRQKQEERERTARKDLLVGGGILVVGLAITVISYYNAGSSGSYVVAWGAMLVGAFRFFKGVSGN